MSAGLLGCFLDDGGVFVFTYEFCSRVVGWISRLVTYNYLVH